VGLSESDIYLPAKCARHLTLSLSHTHTHIRSMDHLASINRGPILSPFLHNICGIQNISLRCLPNVQEFCKKALRCVHINFIKSKRNSKDIQTREERYTE